MTMAVPPSTSAQPRPALLSRVIDAIRINAVDQNPSDTIVQKHRTWLSRRTANLANLYFAIAKIPIRFCTRTADWHQREINSFRTLNPGCVAYAVNKNTLCAQRLPGRNLYDHLADKTLTRRMLVAAAKEFRRAHNKLVDGQLWTHGDATMANVIYDAAANRARLIDFELHHVKTLPLNQRRADDLLVFLLDLVSGTSNQRWLPLAIAFLQAYDDQNVIRELIPMLRPFRGLARIWFGVRTNWAEPLKVRHRLHELRKALAKHYP